MALLVVWERNSDGDTKFKAFGLSSEVARIEHGGERLWWSAMASSCFMVEALWRKVVAGGASEWRKVMRFGESSW